MPSPRRKKLMRFVACSAALCLAVLVSPTANADPHDPAIPSKQAVEDAQQQVVESQSSVASIEAQLAAADAQLESLGIAAGAAAEAYDGAVYRWQLADKASTAANARADRATAAAALSRSSLAGYVVSHETTGSSLTALTSAMSASGTTALINQLADFSTTSSALDSRFQQWQAATKLAEVYRAQAAQALVQAGDAKQAAADAKQAAAAAVAQQQAAVSSIAAQKTALISELAAAQHTSVELAAQRAAGLERLRQERLAEERRQAALAAQRAAARAERLAEQRREQWLRDHPKPPSDPGQPPQDPPDNPPQQPPHQPPHHPPAGGASTAIAFAYDQLGEPYVWGADGPDSWDCSGLTMGSWAAAGVYLPHYSVAQYAAVEHISFSELQPGDLLFWGTSSSPYSIYHVGMYLGNNQYIQAPHTGDVVKISGLYDWTLPNFFGRP